MKPAVATLLLTLLFPFGLLAQRTNLVNFQNDRKVTDSLKSLLLITTDPVEKSLLYQALCWNYKNSNLDSTNFYANKGIELATEIDQLKIVADITRFKGIATWNFMHHNVAFDLYNEALQISKEINDLEGEGFAYDRIGVTYFYKDSFPQAEACFQKAKNIFLKIRHYEGLGYSYSHMNWVATAQKKYSTALFYGNEALRVRILDKDKIGESNSMVDIGLVYKEMGAYSTALSYVLSGFEISRAKNYQQGIAEQAQDVADLYFIQQEYEEAFKYATLAYETAKEIENSLQVAESAKMMTQILEQKQDYKGALYYKGIYHSVKDSLFNDEVRRKTMLHEFQYDYEKQKQKLIEHENLTKMFLRSLVFMVSIIAIFIFIGRRRKQKDNMLLKRKNEEIQKQKGILEQQAIELEHSNKMKNRLFSIISHDLKTPFANTSMLIKLFDDGIVSESEFKEMLPRVNEQLKNSSDLLDNLLLWAKNQMEGYKLNYEKLNLFVLVENHVELFKITSQNKRITVFNQIKPSLFANADKAMIEIVLRNLLSNALKFCDYGDTITFNAFEANGTITVRVEDSGRGISKERIRILFKGYVPTIKGTANETGTGLGLMLCKDLIEKNNGNIWVESTVGQGTTFYFTLPAYTEQLVTPIELVASAN